MKCCWFNGPALAVNIMSAKVVDRSDMWYMHLEPVFHVLLVVSCVQARPCDVFSSFDVPLAGMSQMEEGM